MSDELNKRIKQIPILQDHATQLLCLAKEIVSSRQGAYERDDFLGAMADIFMHMQMDHLKSICILVNADQNPDALIISRSSFENMALLLWSAHGPPRENRPRKWFLNEIKGRYCKIMKGENKELGIDPNFETDIRQYIQIYADILLTKAAKKKLHLGKALPIYPDPFVLGRLPPIKNMFDELKKKGEIDQKAYPLYQILSQWPHGTPQGSGMVFRHDGNSISHDESINKYLGGCAIMTGLQSLNITAILFNDHYKLGFKEKLEELRNQYLEL